MTVALTDAAREDLADIYAYYAQRTLDSADRVVGTILAATDGLAQFPLMGRPGEVPTTRERIVTRYPYRIVYHIEGDTIEVWRIVHGAQHWPPAAE